MFPPTLDKPLSSVCAQSQPEGCCCSLQSPPGILRPPDYASAAGRTSLRRPDWPFAGLPDPTGPPTHLVIGCRCSGIILLGPQLIAQAERGNFIVQARIMAFASGLPDPAVHGRGFLVPSRRAQQVALFQRHEDILGIAADQLTSNGQCLIVTMFAPKKQREQNLGINAGLSTAGGTLLKI